MGDKHYNEDKDKEEILQTPQRYQQKLSKQKSNIVNNHNDDQINRVSINSGLKKGGDKMKTLNSNKNKMSTIRGRPDTMLKVVKTAGKNKVDNIDKKNNSKAISKDITISNNNQLSSDSDDQIEQIDLSHKNNGNDDKDNTNNNNNVSYNNVSCNSSNKSIN